MNKLNQAEYFTDGNYYKFGLHNKPFIWLNDAWVLSNKYPSEIKQGKLLPLAWPVDNSRIDIIGLNGNDGLHYESEN